MQDIEQEATNDNQIDMENIHSTSFNSRQLVIVAKLKTSPNQSSTKYLTKLTEVVLEI